MKQKHKTTEKSIKLKAYFLMISKTKKTTVWLNWEKKEDDKNPQCQDGCMMPLNPQLRWNEQSSQKTIVVKIE
jgi:hypothetical protein